MAILPKSKPQLTREAAEKILAANNLPLDKCYLIGIRGYFLDSMGKTGVTDRGLYDSALIWISPSTYATFNGNTNPSRYRKGFGFKAEKGMASLMPGLWKYKTGIHYGKIPHAAFRQAAEVAVERDGTEGQYKDVGFFGINIHKGGSNGTSSLGCQTLPPSQFDAFKGLGYGELKRYNQDTFTYILIEESRRRKGALKA